MLRTLIASLIFTLLMRAWLKTSALAVSNPDSGDLVSIERGLFQRCACGGRTLEQFRSDQQ